MKYCPNCHAELPDAARFCIDCGREQPPAPAPAAGKQKAKQPEPLTIEDAEVVEEPVNPDPVPSSDEKPGTTANSIGIEWGEELLPQFRRLFWEEFKDYFARLLPHRRFDEVEQLLRESDFGDIIGSTLRSQREYYSRRRTEPNWDPVRAELLFRHTAADLLDYFLIKYTGPLRKVYLPERILGFQTARQADTDPAHLCQAYLELDLETDPVYTDFVRMPTRKLKNAMQSFLTASPQERIYFILDQSLLGNCRNGFALTDVGIYWRSLLNEAGAAFYQDLADLRIDPTGFLSINGCYFDAGPALNLKLCLLLAKLRRMAQAAR